MTVLRLLGAAFVADTCEVWLAGGDGLPGVTLVSDGTRVVARVASGDAPGTWRARAVLPKLPGPGRSRRITVLDASDGEVIGHGEIAAGAPDPAALAGEVAFLRAEVELVKRLLRARLAEEAGTG